MNGNCRRCRFRNGCWADPEDPADLADPEDLVGLVAQVVQEALAAAAEAPRRRRSPRTWLQYMLRTASSFPRNSMLTER